MTFLIRIFTLISLYCTHSLAVYAKEVSFVSVEELLSIANEELEEFADESGYYLLNGSSSLPRPISSIVDFFSARAFHRSAHSAFFLVDFFVNGHRRYYGVPFINYVRSRFNYYLVNKASGKVIEGSCLYFFRMGESGYTLDIEIDNCSHDDIFSQDVPGTMRLGDSVDFFERHFSDEDEVVVSKSVPIEPR